MAPINKSAFQNYLLLATALFAFLWAIVRAQVQSITIDEAFTYLYFVAKPLKIVFSASSNNHVLNSLLMWMTTHTFGTSNITVRAPALLGALLYIFTCRFLCQSVTNRFSLQLPLFICLTYNPLVGDFMVAARGYSLADAFLLAAVATPVRHRVQGVSLRACCGLASIALGLSFAANFSFAFVDGAAFLAIMIWAIRRRERESVMRVIALCTLPGLLVALLICGQAVMHEQKVDLWYGAHSLNEMTQSLLQSSFYQLDPKFRDSRWYQAMNFLQPWLLPALAILCFCRLVTAWFDGSWLESAQTRWLKRFAAALAGIVTLSILMSWLAFRFDQLPLPLGRTGIYLVPLCTLIAGIIAAAPARSSISQWFRRGVSTVLISLACYFLLCLRLTYFKEYEWDADVKDVYSVLARLNHAYGVNDAGVTGYYVAALNYYRVQSMRETFPEFRFVGSDLPAGKPIYVLSGGDGREFINQQKLAVIYRGKRSDVVVAVQPGGPIPPAMVDP